MSGGTDNYLLRFGMGETKKLRTHLTTCNIGLITNASRPSRKMVDASCGEFRVRLKPDRYVVGVSVES